MRSGLIVTAALVSALTASTALADRYEDGTRHANQIRDRVLHNEKTGYGRTEKTQTVRTENVSRRIEAKVLKRDRGEVIDNYGKSHNGTTTRTVSTTSKITKSPIQQKEEMADGNKTSKSSSSMGKQVGWSASGKSIRSYVHFVNDKGEVNNNIHGSTAMGMKMRHVAAVLLRTAGIFGKLFDWQGSGGDNSEQAF